MRIYAVLRRTYKEDSPLLVLDGCTIDFSRAEVNKGSEIISLTAKEHTLLETLARNAGKIVTVDALCEALWGDNPFGYETSLNAHVRRVREKIETDPSKPVSLITIKAVSYTHLDVYKRQVHVLGDLAIYHVQEPVHHKDGPVSYTHLPVRLAWRLDGRISQHIRVLQRRL